MRDRQVAPERRRYPRVRHVVSAFACALFAQALLGCNASPQVSASGGDGGHAGPIAFAGYLEGYKLPSGSDAVKMQLSLSGDGHVTGSVFFGAAPALAPPISASVGYPAGYPTSTGPEVLEGVAFTVLDGVQAGSRVTFKLQPKELWRAWCRLQTKTYDLSDGGGSNWSCAPMNGGGSQPGCGAGCCETGADGGRVPADCGKQDLCSWGGPCTCTATGCDVVLDATRAALSFDMRLDGDRLDGTWVRSNVHLMRVP